MSTSANNLTISTSDIADLANVGRSTVSNWRQRHAEFPKPVGGSPSSPRFKAAEVHAWLKANGKEVKDLSPDRALWNVMEGLRGLASPEETGELVSSMLVWRYVSDPSSEGFDNALPEEAWWPNLRGAPADGDLIRALEYGMHAFEGTHPERLPLFNALGHDTVAGWILKEAANHDGLVDRIIAALSSFPADSIGSVFVAFRDRLTNSSLRGYDESATSAKLVDLVAAVCSSIPGPVHDPAAGSGRMLLAVGSQGEGRTALTGQDIRRAACAQANQRALVSGFDNVTVRHGDVFDRDYFERGLAHVVVMDPPYGLSYHQPERLYLDPRFRYGPPPKSRMDVAWLQLALWYLDSGGRAIILQPSGSAFQAGAVGKIRSAMLQNGTVEAVVALPGGLASHTQIPLNLWVLARPGETSDPERVLLIDHSQSKDVDVNVIARELRDWRNHRSIPAESPAGAFTIAEIIADGANLTPKRWTTSSPKETVRIEEVHTRVEDLHRATTKIKQPVKLRAEALSAGRHEPQLVTVNDLIKAESATLLKSNERVREDDYSADGTPVVTGAWIRNNETKPRHIDLKILKHTPVLTQPGDVLVQVTGGLSARVDTEGGRALLSPSYQLIRLTGDVVRPGYLAEFIMTLSNQSQAFGTAIQRVKLQDLKIPLLPLVDQDNAMESITEIRRLQTAARAVLEASEAARDTLVEALAAGTVTVA